MINERDGIKETGDLEICIENGTYFKWTIQAHFDNYTENYDNIQHKHNMKYHINLYLVNKSTYKKTVELCGMLKTVRVTQLKNSKFDYINQRCWWFVSKNDQ